MADKKKNSIVAQAEARAEQMVQAKAKSKPAKKGAKKQNGIVKYFRDLRSEFKKVVWPSRQKVVNNSGVVLTAMVISGLAIWGVDSGLTALLKAVLDAASK